MPTTDATELRDAATAELDPTTLYRILALRSEVFVLEQECAYLDLDGRDLEPDARQLWVARGADVLATARLLRDTGDGGAVVRVGRVATAASARGSGLGAQLMNRAIVLAAGAPMVLEAQAHLQAWYAGFGFATASAEYLEDGIAHVTMRRPAG